MNVMIQITNVQLIFFYLKTNDKIEKNTHLRFFTQEFIIRIVDVYN